MASAGLLRILHSGLQDERLLSDTVQPFDKAFIKTGRFTTEWYRVDFDNRPAFGVQAKATIPRRGHLITRAFLVTTMPDILTAQTKARDWCTTNSKDFCGPTFGWTNSVGHALITNAQVTIGGNPIDNLDGRFLEVFAEFNTPFEKLTTVNRLLGRSASGFTPKSNQSTGPYVTPLPFWFARGDPSAALPIDAIGTDPVQLSITFNSINNVYTTTSRSLNNDSKQILGPLLNSPFYFSDSAGSSVSGLQGNPTKSQLVSKVPGITMPESLTLPSETYLLLEYVYLDKPEANRLRLAELSYIIPQHYPLTPFDTRNSSLARIPIRVPNPLRELYFTVHRTDADLLNAPFLATRDLSGLFITDISGVGSIAPWWPDASGLDINILKPLVPAYSQLDSEPLASFSIIYEGKLVRYATDSPALFRSILPSFEKRKTPFINKYYYNIPFGTQHDYFGITQHGGEANFDKLTKVELSLQFQGGRGNIGIQDIPSYTVYVWAETYNVLKVYGGRAGLLFNYAVGASQSAGTWSAATGSSTNSADNC
jgi:hypothetical protein